LNHVKTDAFFCVSVANNTNRLDAPQAYSPQHFALRSERLGPLPLINRFLERLGLQALLDQYVPTRDRRSTVSHAQALGVLLQLQYKRNEASEMVEKAIKRNPGVETCEEILNEVYKGRK